MSETRGVFSLGDVVEQKGEGDYVVLDDVWHSPSPSPSADTGYFGGGLAPSTVSTMDKLTYSTDTTAYTPGANLSSARRFVAATGSQIHGYFGGGATTPGAVTASMDKTTYSSDTTAATPGANLSVARFLLIATGNETHGYFGGGYATPTPVTTMDKTTYSSDTTAATPGATLSIARFGIGAVGNNTHGYFGGGRGPVFIIQQWIRSLIQLILEQQFQEQH